jgi:hypothetical protein
MEKKRKFISRMFVYFSEDKSTPLWDRRSTMYQLASRRLIAPTRKEDMLDSGLILLLLDSVLNSGGNQVTSFWISECS